MRSFFRSVLAAAALAASAGVAVAQPLGCVLCPLRATPTVDVLVTTRGCVVCTPGHVARFSAQLVNQGAPTTVHLITYVDPGYGREPIVTFDGQVEVPTGVTTLPILARIVRTTDQEGEYWIVAAIVRDGGPVVLTEVRARIVK